MSALCFFLILYLCHCIVYPHLGVSAASKAQLHLGPPPCTPPPFWLLRSSLNQGRRSLAPRIFVLVVPLIPQKFPWIFRHIFWSLCKGPFSGVLPALSYLKLQTIPTFPVLSLFFSLKELFNSHHLLPPTPSLYWFVVYSVPRAGP